MRKILRNKPFVYTLAVFLILFVLVGGFFLSRTLIQTSARGEKDGSGGAEHISGNSGDSEDGKGTGNVSETDSVTFGGTKDDKDNPRISSGSETQNYGADQGNETKNDESDSGNGAVSGQQDPDLPVPDKDYSAIKHPVVMLDPGHGGIDNGCEAGNILEKDVNYDITLKVKALLEEKGYEVVLTREDDVKVFLEERVQASKDVGADVFVSIHQNLYDGPEAESVAGIETYFNSYNSPKGSEKLANLVQSKVAASTEARDRGVREVDDLVVVVKVTCPSILIETGFLSNTKECAKLLSDDYQTKIASGIADAINAFFRE